MTAMWNNLVILLGARALLSLTGIILLVVGNWLSDRLWDEQSDNNDNSTDSALYLNMPDADASTNDDSSFWKQISWNHIHTTLHRGNDPIGKKTLYSKITLTGWILLASSCTFSLHGWFAEEKLSSNMILRIVLILLLGIFHIFVLPKAMEARQVYRYRNQLSRILVMTYLGLGVLVCWHNPEPPLWLAPVGSLSLALAPMLLWLERKRGHDRDIAAAANDATRQRLLPATVFSLGGPLLVFGWVALWVAWNATHGAPSYWYIPLYFHAARSQMAWLGAVMLLLTLWTAGYAHDEAAITTTKDNNSSDISTTQGTNRQGQGLGLWGRFSGDPDLVNVCMLIAWAVWAVAAFLPYAVGYEPWILCLLCLGQGVLWAQLYRSTVAVSAVADAASTQSASVETCRPQQLEQLQTVVHRCIFLVSVWIVVLVNSVDSVSASILGSLGVLLIAVGLYALHRDRRRGENSWRVLQPPQPTGEPQPAGLIVYSMGALLVPTGLSCLAYAVSVPR
jgi:hypothetical protein